LNPAAHAAQTGGLDPVAAVICSVPAAQPPVVMHVVWLGPVVHDPEGHAAHV